VRGVGTNTAKKVWQVYIVRCVDGTLYTGIARDVVRRVAEHNGANGRGAKYTRGRQPVVLSYAETQPNLSGALKREAEIKRISKMKKEILVLSGPASLHVGRRKI